ncbi:hypothetical protein CANTEDRAFT_135512 [Yamadazyma tenuis ATCC 10573]|uniref:Uncharacterized protein n=1 Tax=Candida tenuis (strain ATCC 10573 / BCRC 21748 / CBS 615 / JCM 9827 / NBRC 10315 / NRRL Y-1498 / VKM Y-70) TaxID=590646 RepID=G3BBL6_CANTC|nr:uncharacterized protein CANTEDRAFT_135512 [Yamadazyma tenuis ATCC 10573]EGV61567.1 hypothetical protein CANTEDRAFT_135512 [Yamadazyma tenuis ATCC 10573]
MNSQTMSQRLAIPHLLPYTAIEPLSDQIKLSSKIFKSTSMKAITEAYNTTLIEAILVPEIEHQVNYHHKVKPLEEIVNEKGPFRVRIRYTNAGTISIPFLKTQTPRLQPMKEVGIAVKNSVRDAEIRKNWESTTSPSSNDKKTTDGAFEIGWYRVYGPKATMFSKEHHAELHSQEALWEFLLDQELLKGVDENGESVTVEEVRSDVSQIKKSYTDSWLQTLNEVSGYFASRCDQHYQKYGGRYINALFDEKIKWQNRMDETFEKKIRSYEQLINSLEVDRVTMHSDLVSPKSNGSSSDKQLVTNDKRVKKRRVGMGLHERRGLGKRLGDYMEENGVPCYKIGMKFDKKFRF